MGTYFDIPNFKVGQNINLLVDNDNRHKRHISGKIIQITEYVVYIKTKSCVESFMKKDFQCGRVLVRRKDEL